MNFFYSRWGRTCLIFWLAGGASKPRVIDNFGDAVVVDIDQRLTCIQDSFLYDFYEGWD